MLTCFEKTAMSSLKLSDEQTSPPATPGSRGVQVASSHFSKIRASSGNRGCLKLRIFSLVSRATHVQQYLKCYGHLFCPFFYFDNLFIFAPRIFVPGLFIKLRSLYGQLNFKVSSFIFYSRSSDRTRRYDYRFLKYLQYFLI
jgi:hypothetical protein